MQILNNPSEQYKAWIAKPSSWIIIVVVLLGLLLGMFAWDSYKYIQKHMATEVVTANVVHYRTTVSSRVYKFQAVRKYNKYSTPSCSWDQSEEEVCDEWYYECVETNIICVRRDSTGCIETQEKCVRERKVYCIESHMEYDYSIYDWKKHSNPKKDFWDRPHNTRHLDRFSDPAKWNVSTSVYYYAYVKRDSQSAKLRIPKINFNRDTYKVVRRKHSKKIIELYGK